MYTMALNDEIKATKMIEAVEMNLSQVHASFKCQLFE